MRYIFILVLLFGCTLEPEYQRPELSIELKPANTESDLTLITWQEFFNSPQLKQVIEIALKNNQDLKAAYLNIELARTNFDIDRKALIPTIDATANVTRQELPGTASAYTQKSIYRANLNTSSYELDFFGKLRNAKKSSYENLLATEEAKNIIKIAVITDTANAYLQLLADQNILALIDKALIQQEQKVSIIAKRQQNGRAFKTDVLAAKSDYETIKVLRNSYTKIVEQDKNALMLLLGVFNEDQIPQADLEDIAFNEELLEFLPSEILLSRPDIKQAEHLLKSANADIGIARAAFFPSISITGTYGYYSNDFSDLFSANAWSFIPEINLPIFDGGKNKANLKLSKVQKEILTVQYQQTIQTAFKEALDELANRQENLEHMRSYLEIVKLKQQSYEIMQKKYDFGAADAVTVSDAYLEFITAKQNAINQQQEYLQNLIMLYKVFGGGSNQELN